MQLNWNLFVKCIITGNETWIHHDDPEIKQQSLQWKHASSPSPRKFKVQASAGKVCNVFWDAEDVLLISYMPHKVTVTGRDVNETLRSETETRPRRLTSSSRRDRDRDLITFHEIETETFNFGSETRPRR